MSSPALIFDLDGTLIDSKADLASAVSRMRAELALPPLSVADVMALIGRGARDLVRRSLPAEVEGEAFETAFSRFRHHYAEVCLDQTRLFPGLAELLSFWAASRPLAVLTNKPEGVSRQILEGLGISHLFAAVVGGDTLQARKPDPVGLHTLATQFGEPVSALTLVGDSAIDAATAQAAGCRFVFVEWGFASEEERAGLVADTRVSTAEELSQVL